MHIRTDELKWYSVWNLLWWDCAYSALESVCASICLGANLEFVILSLEEYSGETAPIGLSNCCSVILVVDWCMDNTLQ